MPQFGEPVAPPAILPPPAPPAPVVPPPPPPKSLIAALLEIKFESGIEIFDVKSGGASPQLPAAGTPHWGAAGVFPAVYVRQGGVGETKGLKIKVKWKQTGCAGSADLEGESSDGKIKIEGKFNIAGDDGEIEVNCEFSKKPDTVTNYGKGIGFFWKVTASGVTAAATGAAVLRLFFVNAKPKPVAGATWPYKKHYLQVIDWATQWAKGKQGEAAVFKDIWAKFSYKTFWRGEERAHIPHITGFSYWPHGDAARLAQSLDKVVEPGYAAANGWSCKGIAHLFMECLALHGIQCKEIMPLTPNSAKSFLVHNWDVTLAPEPNWYDQPDDHYGGSWVSTPTVPPLKREVRTGLKKKIKPAMAPPPLPPAAPAPAVAAPPPPPPEKPLEIEFKKKSGVPGQGQANPPLFFRNHWIVEYSGKLYDTSYGIEHNTINITDYGKKALAGWFIDFKKETGAKSGYLWWIKPEPLAYAFVCHVFANHTLIKVELASN
jgi:hypothetical protein